MHGGIAQERPRGFRSHLACDLFKDVGGHVGRGAQDQAVRGVRSELGDLRLVAPFARKGDNDAASHTHSVGCKLLREGAVEVRRRHIIAIEDERIATARASTRSVLVDQVPDQTQW